LKERNDIKAKTNECSQRAKTSREHILAAGQYIRMTSQTALFHGSDVAQTLCLWTNPVGKIAKKQSEGVHFC